MPLKRGPHDTRQLQHRYMRHGIKLGTNPMVSCTCATIITCYSRSPGQLHVAGFQVCIAYQKTWKLLLKQCFNKNFMFHAGILCIHCRHVCMELILGDFQLLVAAVKQIQVHVLFKITWTATCSRLLDMYSTLTKTWKLLLKQCFNKNLGCVYTYADK